MLQAIQVHNVPHKQTPLAFTLLAIAVVMERAIIPQDALVLILALIPQAAFATQAIQVPHVPQKFTMIAGILLAIAVVMESVIHTQAAFVMKAG